MSNRSLKEILETPIEGTSVLHIIDDALELYDTSIEEKEDKDKWQLFNMLSQVAREGFKEIIALANTPTPDVNAELLAALKGMVESYDVMMQAIPETALVRGSILGAFLNEPHKARKLIARAEASQHEYADSRDSGFVCVKCGHWADDKPAQCDGRYAEASQQAPADTKPFEEEG